MKRNPETLSDAEYDRIVAAMQELQRHVLPAGWTGDAIGDNAAIFVRRDGLKVIQEVEQHEDQLWIHVSVSVANGQVKGRLPSYEQLGEAKSLFIGDARKAIQVFPAKGEHFSMFEVLHLFAPLERDPLPDLRRWDGGL